MWLVFLSVYCILYLNKGYDETLAVLVIFPLFDAHDVLLINGMENIPRLS